MHRATILTFVFVVVACYAFLWGAAVLIPTGAATGMVLVGVTVLGLWLVRPGWDVRPRRLTGYWLSMFVLLLASAAAAAWFLTSFKVRHPYDLSSLDLKAALPAIAAITGIEELLFRHVAFRWLEQRGVPGRTAVVGTALAFGGAHLGPLFVEGAGAPVFYLLQGAYQVWIGLLLGEIRRGSHAWTMAWLGHFGYNVAVLYVLLLLR